MHQQFLHCISTQTRFPKAMYITVDSVTTFIPFFYLFFPTNSSILTSVVPITVMLHAQRTSTRFAVQYSSFDNPNPG